MNKKNWMFLTFIGVLLTIIVLYSLTPTFEGELEYYREFAATNIAWNNNKWIIRDVTTDPMEFRDPRTKTNILLSSFWDIKNFSETYSGMYGAEVVFKKSTYKEVRETAELYKAIYIWYDSNEKIIWTVAPRKPTWIYTYWEASWWKLFNR